MATFDKESFIKKLQNLETTRFGRSLSSEEITELLEEPVQHNKDLEEPVQPNKDLEEPVQPNKDLEEPVKVFKFKIKRKNKNKNKNKKKNHTPEYFIKIAKKHNRIIYKYKPSIFWTGPAIVDDFENLEKVRNQFTKKIPIKVDQSDDRKRIIVYPAIKVPKNVDIEYDMNYEPEDNPTEYWTYNDETYIVDMITNEVFDSSTECFIGLRINNELNFE